MTLQTNKSKVRILALTLLAFTKGENITTSRHLLPNTGSVQKAIVNQRINWLGVVHLQILRRQYIISN